MIYIIGGVTRSGKSVLTCKLSKKYGLPYFNLDYLMRAMRDSGEDFGFEGETHDRLKSQAMWYLVKPLLKHVIRDEKEGYIVDGVTILPEQLKELEAEHPGEIKACWMGYAEANKEEKFEIIRRCHDLDLSGDWLKHADDGRVNLIVDYGVEFSGELREECKELNIPYVETSHNFEAALEEVEKILFK